MNAPLRIRTADVPPQPWRNGGGVTRELLASPDGTDWRVRVSVADIDRDGPFSVFPGVQRCFAVLEGAGVELTLDGGTQRVRRGDAPLAFRGDVPAGCRLLDGPTRDLNLMLREASGTMRIAQDGEAWVPPRGCAVGLYALASGRLQADARSLPATANELLWFDEAPAMLRFVTVETPAPTPPGFWLSAALEPPPRGNGT